MRIPNPHWHINDLRQWNARAPRRRWHPGADLVVLATFDLLAHQGRDLYGAPIERRKARLQQLLAGTDTGILVRVVG
ncbi:hypothetical protein D8I24_6548 [Cupriavidus necator H850]|uniref:hypothetical protein n=1 Tax=Cupriavidus necator TaxID=106590 RepID=UPI00129E90C7|nr:hypothetical protein [Cupriavidus necator]KAI3597732.1 hypothetical protein D8I24_6548 [Cupriavidus necator H850]